MDFCEITNLSKKYYTKDGEILAVDRFSLNIEKGKIIALVGPSGCGKSTILSMLAGIETPTGGKIHFEKDNPVLGYMLQHDTLFDWLNVEENAMLPLTLMKNKDSFLQFHVKHLIKTYGLEEYKKLYPRNLSGGMRQRVALIRTLATKPDILLLDESFSALDYLSRLKVTEDVMRIIKAENQTVIMVTHDIAEAISMADIIVTLSSVPATIKNIYEVKLDNKSTPLNNRTDPKFSYYFEKIWRDLNEE